MTRQALTLFILLSTVSLAFSQKFSPGYYVTLSGDTIKAQLSLRQKGGTILGVLTQGNRLLGVKDVSAVRIDISNYVVKRVRIDKSPRVLGDVLDTLFLEVMVREKMSLLYSIDEGDKAHYFVEDEHGTIEELGLRILDRGDGLNFQELTVYKQTFKTLFPECKDLHAAVIDKTRYTKNSILATFRTLYECKYGSLPVVESSKELVHDYGITVGISSTKIGFESKGGTLLDGLIFDRSTDLIAGAFVETRFTRTGNIFSIRQELTHRKYDATSQDYNNGGQTTILGQVSASYIKYNLMAKAAISHNTLRPFLCAGVSPSILLKSSDRALFMSSATQASYPLLNGHKSFDFGMFVGTGLMFDDFYLEARVERSSGLQPGNAESGVNTLYFMLSYRFVDGRY